MAGVMIRSLAFQLANVVPRLWKPILAAAETPEGNERQQDLTKLFEALLMQPLKTVDDADLGQPVVALIDALDEAEGQGGSRNEVRL
jgi:hypothetical protein